MNIYNFNPNTAHLRGVSRLIIQYLQAFLLLLEKFTFSAFLKRYETFCLRIICIPSAACIVIFKSVISKTAWFFKFPELISFHTCFVTDIEILFLGMDH